MTYLGAVRRNTLWTPQTQKARPDQISNAAGGFTFEVSPWDRLERFLILGTEGGTYYASEQKLTVENAKNVMTCIRENGAKVVGTILQISHEGRAPKNDSALFALAMCAAYGDIPTRQAALNVLPKVARTGSHLLQFVSYVSSMRGWGRALKNGVANWYLEKDADDLAYQLTKYASRYGYTQGDVLRLTHPYSEDDGVNSVLRYAVGKSVDFTATPHLLDALNEIKENPEKVRTDLIRDHRLSREVLPTEWLQKPEVWEALLEHMPMTAMIRNLATMTRLGLITERSAATQRIVNELADVNRIRKARVHPMAILIASKTYNSGRGLRGSGTWIPSNAIVSALDKAFYLAYGNVEPTNKKTLIALDISGSMTTAYGGLVMGIPGFTPREATAALALITVNTEPNADVMTFHYGRSGRYVPIQKDQSLERVVQYINGLLSGGTDLSEPMRFAMEQHAKPYESIIIYTDNETWSGHNHPFEVLQSYRAIHGIPTKLATVSVTATANKIADPNDLLSMDFIGFDANVPQALAEFLS